jgi:superfamily II DNA/RNA helicase
VQEALFDGLREFSPLAITGDMSAKSRREAIRSFQDDPEVRIIICSLKAAQTAITLTAARRALLVELDWTPSSLEQAEDRIHRIGQAGQVVITYLVARETLDERMAAVLGTKREKIKIVAGSNAPFGYRNDGSARKQRPGPGRPRVAPEIQTVRRKASKATWQACNLDYFRDYMRKRRIDEKVKEYKQAQEELAVYRLGYGYARSVFGLGSCYRLKDYENDLAAAVASFERADKKLKRAGISVD